MMGRAPMPSPLPVEEPVPFQEEVQHVDDDLVVIDNPQFLPTTPGGRYLLESALVQLRTRLANPDLTPIRRLDHATADLVMTMPTHSNRLPEPLARELEFTDPLSGNRDGSSHNGR